MKLAQAKNGSFKRFTEASEGGKPSPIRKTELVDMAKHTVEVLILSAIEGDEQIFELAFGNLVTDIWTARNHALKRDN